MERFWLELETLLLLFLIFMLGVASAFIIRHGENFLEQLRIALS